MDYFVELSSSEDSNGYDFSTSKETEVALYNLVHHSEDTYSTDITTQVNLANNSSVSKRSLRWNSFRNLGDSSEYFGTFSNFGNNNQKEDFMPFEEYGVGSNTNNMHDKSVSGRMTWNNNKYRRPWKNRDKVPYIRKLVSVNIDCLNNSGNGNLPVQENNSNLASTKFSSSKFTEKPPFNSQSENLNYLSVQDQDVPKDSHKGSEIRESGSETTVNLEICEPVIESKNNKSLIPLSKEIEQGKHERPEERRVDDNECKASYTSVCDIIAKCVPNTNTVKSISQNDEEILTISDSEDNDSIVEISIPAKPNPPVIALDSSDEVDSICDSAGEPVINVLPALGHSEDVGTPEVPNNVSTTQHNVSNEVIDPLLVSHKGNSIQVKKKNKSKKQSRNKIVEYVSWTEYMDKFYNKSWGGETFDHVQIQQKMSNNPSKWKILDIDKYGPIKNHGPCVRCAVCNRSGHRTKDCSDPRKIKCCFMCGMQGHGELQCPYKLCLKCGRPAPLFYSGCPLCWSKDHPTNCTTCGDKEHFSWMCPSVWRKFHSITSTEDLTTTDLQFPQLKPIREQSCCFCAGQGHTASVCPFLSRSKQNNSNNLINPAFFPSPRGKKRKMKRYSHFEWNKRQEYNKKRRKTK